MTTPTLEKALAVANGEENNLGIKLGDKAVQNGDHVVWKGQHPRCLVLDGGGGCLKV